MKEIYEYPLITMLTDKLQPITGVWCDNVPSQKHKSEELDYQQCMHNVSSKIDVLTKATLQLVKQDYDSANALKYIAELNLAWADFLVKMKSLDKSPHEGDKED